MRFVLAALCVMTMSSLNVWAAPPAIAPQRSVVPLETPALAVDVKKGALPGVTQRLPGDVLVVDLTLGGRKPGISGGTLHMLMSKEKDVRLLNTWGYARLVGWTPQLLLKPDILKSVDVKDGRAFTFHLRAGHKWSDGASFTSEDFRYFWQDVASNKELSPGGPPIELSNDGEFPKVEILDSLTVRYRWSKPNGKFLATLAQAREPFIYRPAHYLKQFHSKYANAAELAKRVGESKARSWAQLHNRMDAMYDNTNPELPSLQPWVITTSMPANRFVFKRNPFFHRVDTNGVQLPYIDAIEVVIADSGLIAAKTAAGDSDLQARGLSFADATVLKANEAKGHYKVITWPIANGSHFALYPNLNTNDAGWRQLMRDVRFRRALSLGLNRADINRALFFGMASEGNNAVLKSSPLFKPTYLTENASFDVKGANALLDQAGLTRRTADGTRLMADGRPLELVVEIAGESKEEADILQLVMQHYKPLGIKLVIKPSDRTQLRNRAYSGEAVMTAWKGWDTGIPTPEMSPEELAPTRQDTLSWPKWGNFFETQGKSGEAPDLPEAKQLLKLAADWNGAKSTVERAAVWDKMLKIHAEQEYIIGTVSGVMQPIVVRSNVRNFPDQGVFSWDPGAQLGMYRMDELWLSK